MIKETSSLRPLAVNRENFHFFFQNVWVEFFPKTVDPPTKNRSKLEKINVTTPKSSCFTFSNQKKRFPRSDPVVP